MKIKSIELAGFRCFKNLTIELPETACLIVMIGPNGSGKSSVFDALQLKTYLGDVIDQTKISDNYHQIMEYYLKSDDHEFGYSPYKYTNQNKIPRVDRYPSYGHIVVLEGDIWNLVNIQFHGTHPIREYEWDKSVHVRSAYRNYSITNPHIINRDNPIKDSKLVSLTENDETVVSNYWRLASQWLERSSEIEKNAANLVDLQNEILDELCNAIGRLFIDPPLVLKNLGHPSDNALFHFEKGNSKRFSFQNLASGEKAALDLLLDVIVTKEEWDETIICIDEPEAHIHTKLQGQLLQELYHLISPKSQLWIATHSIGMVRKAQELWHEDPDSVVFLDFGKDASGQDRDFDGQVTLTPAKPNPNFWAQTYEVALGDLAELVITGRTVFCEGEEFDAECYKHIFKDTYPEVCFVSLGARGNVEKSVTAANLAIEKIAKRAKVIGIVDRDKATCGEIKRNAAKGIRTLSRTTIESYLLDDEVLTKLCEDNDEPDKVEDLLAAKQAALDRRGLKASDNLKPIVQQVHGAAQKVLKSANLGNTRESFMMDMLARRIQPGMKVYEELERDIFDDH